MVAVAAPRQLPRLLQHKKALIFAGIVLAWLVLWLVFRNVGTLSLGAADLTPLHRWVNEVNDAVGASRNSNPVFLYFFNEIRLVIDEFVTFIQALIAQPSFGKPVPVIGWLGVVAISRLRQPRGHAAGGSRCSPSRASCSSACRACGRRAWTRSP